MALGSKERIIINSATGGGYGDPLERDPELVKWDVREEFISNQRAREVYGVVLDTESEHYTVDAKETKKLRREMKRERGRNK